MNYSQSTRKRIADLVIGMRVDKAANASPLVQDTPLFQIIGGKVMVTFLIGEVTTVIQTTATTIRFRFDADVGSDAYLSGGSTDLSAVAVGSQIGITGTAAGEVLVGNALAPAQAQPIVLSEGYIDVNYGAAATGAIKYSVWYIPLENGAYIKAA